MLRTKFRLRWQSLDLDDKLVELLNESDELAKQVFRVDRRNMIGRLLKSRIDVPITPSNLVYLGNLFFIKSKEIQEITPKPIIAEVKDNEGPLGGREA